MSDQQSKNYDGAKKAYSSHVERRTISQGDVCRARDLGAANTSHGRVSAPIDRKAAKIVGKSPCNTSSFIEIEDTDTDTDKEEEPTTEDCTRRKKWRRDQLKIDVEDTDTEEDSATQDNRKKRKRNQLKPTQRVGRRRIDLDSNSEYKFPEETEMEKVEETEFRNYRKHSKSKIGRPVKQGECAASSSKIIHGSSKCKSSTNHSKSFSPRHCSTKFDIVEVDSSPLAKKGKTAGHTSCKELKFEQIDEAEFLKAKSRSTSKTSSSTRLRSSATISKRSADIVKEPLPDNYRGGRDSDGEQIEQSSSFDQKESNSKSKFPEEIESEEVEETEFRNYKKHSKSKIGRSVKQQVHCTASSSKNIHGASKHISSTDHSKSFSPRHYRTKFNVLEVNPSPFAKKGKTAGHKSCKELKFEQIDEAEFLKAKSRSTSKISSSTRPGSSATISKRSADIVKEPRPDNYRGTISSEDCGRDSDREQIEQSSSFESEGVEETEFRNYKRHSKSMIEQSVKQVHCAASSSKNILGASKHISSTDHSKSFSPMHYRTKFDVLEVDPSPLAKKGIKAGHRSCRKLVIEQIDEADFLKAKSRTTSKIMSSTRQGATATNSRKSADIVKEPPPNYDGGSFSVEDPGRDSDRELTVKSSSFIEKGNSEEDTDSEEPGCSSLYSSSQSSSINISAFLLDGEVSSDAAKHEVNDGIASRTRSKIGSIKKPAEDGNFSLSSSHDSDFSLSLEGKGSDGVGKTKELCSSVAACSEGKSSNSVDVTKELCSSVPACFEGKSYYSVDKTKELCSSVAAFEDNEVHEEITRTSLHDARAEEGLEDRSNCPRCGCSNQSNAQNHSNEARGVNELLPKDQSEVEIRRQKKEASTSHLKDDSAHDDDDDTAHKVKEPTENKHLSLKDSDFCSMLADAILRNGPVLETKGNDEEARQAPQSPSKTQNVLPLKFWFEDELPKEVEKSEHEKEVDDLFAELDINRALEELGSSNYPEVDKENEDSPAEETHYARCSRGKHELILLEDQGLICIFCYHVEHGPKDIMPEWIERTYQDSGRKKYSEAEQPLEFDELHSQSSAPNVADFGNGTVWSINPGIWQSMFEHQRDGFEFLWKNLAGSINLDELKSTDFGGVGGCIISHAPGSGKTRLTINFIETYLKIFPNSMPVIIAPAGMLLTWGEEFKKWGVDFPFLNLNPPEYLCQDNTVARRLLAGRKHRNPQVIRMVKMQTWTMGRSVLGISYSLFEKLSGEKYINGKASRKKRGVLDDQEQKMRKILLEKPGLVVLDEGHTPRNQRSNIWNALLKLKTEKRVILSGTPFQNNFTELFNTFHLVRPAIAGVLAQEKMYAEIITKNRMSKSQRSNRGEHSQSPLFSQVIDRAVDKLKITMAPFVHIHKGDILQKRVPGLRDCVVLLKPPALQKTLIERLEGSQNTFEFEHRVALISVHPYLFQHMDSTEEQKNGIDLAALEASKLNPNEGVKTKFILELVRLSLAMKEKVLIFSQYIQPLELIKEQLKAAFNWVLGNEILHIRGKVGQKHRQVLINSFNDPKKPSKVMLASTKCCSEGISLIGASRVVLLDVVWNPSVERQAICRAYRVGQQKYVYTYHLMTSGTTEADKYCRQAEKERLSELVFSDESSKPTQPLPSLGFEDRILEEMVGNEKLKDMFEKIINQPKDKDLIQTFGLTS